MSRRKAKLKKLFKKVVSTFSGQSQTVGAPEPVGFLPAGREKLFLFGGAAVLIFLAVIFGKR